MHNTGLQWGVRVKVSADSFWEINRYRAADKGEKLRTGPLLMWQVPLAQWECAARLADRLAD